MLLRIYEEMLEGEELTGYIAECIAGALDSLRMLANQQRTLDEYA